MVKKIMCAVLCMSMIISLTACGQPKSESSNTSSVTAESTVSSGAVIVKNTLNGEERETEYKEVPKKVVSLAGFATEMLLALGLEDSIVGYAWQDNAVLPKYADTFAKLKPLCDPGNDPGSEAVLAAEPDLVLSWASSSDDDYFSYKSLTEKNIGYYGFACELEGATLEAVYTDILNLGKIFRIDARAEALVKEMRDNINSVAERIKGKKPVSVFVCDVGSTEELAFTAGGGLVSDIIVKSGGKNIVQGTEKNWTRISWETVAQSNPDWIIIDTYTNKDDVDGTIEFLKSQPALKDLDAVKNDKFIVLGLTDISASERNDDTVMLLASKFHPES